MSDGREAGVPDGWIRDTRDALSHFYDYAYLTHHPLAQCLRGSLGGDAIVAVQKLRRILLEAIEQLRPAGELPVDDPAWRPYTVLYQRYVLAKELSEVEEEMALSKRQIQREQRRAFEALAMVLWHGGLAFSGGQQVQNLDDPLLQEIARTTTLRQVFDVGEQLERALVSVQSMAERLGVPLSVHRPAGALLVTGNPVVFRQMVLSAFSFVLRSVPATALAMRLERHGSRVTCSLAATTASASEKMPSADDLPEMLLRLAASQGVNVSQEGREGEWCLRISLPAADRKPVVALVEDNQDLVALLSRYLASHGYRLVEVGDSSQAVERISEIEPDAVVLDVMMRDVDGWEVLQRLKSDPRLRQIPVAICSVLDEPELATSLGADAYLRKPVRPAQLLECLASLLGQKRNEEAGSW